MRLIARLRMVVGLSCLAITAMLSGCTADSAQTAWPEKATAYSCWPSWSAYIQERSKDIAFAQFRVLLPPAGDALTNTSFASLHTVAVIRDPTELQRLLSALGEASSSHRVAVNREPTDLQRLLSALGEASSSRSMPLADWEISPANTSSGDWYQVFYNSAGNPTLVSCVLSDNEKVVLIPESYWVSGKRGGTVSVLKTEELSETNSAILTGAEEYVALVREAVKKIQVVLNGRDEVWTELLSIPTNSVAYVDFGVPVDVPQRSEKTSDERPHFTRHHLELEMRIKDKARISQLLSALGKASPMRLNDMSCVTLSNRVVVSPMDVQAYRTATDEPVIVTAIRYFGGEAVMFPRTESSAAGLCVVFPDAFDGTNMVVAGGAEYERIVRKELWDHENSPERQRLLDKISTVFEGSIERAVFYEEPDESGSVDEPAVAGNSLHMLSGVLSSNGTTTNHEYRLTPFRVTHVSQNREELRTLLIGLQRSLSLPRLRREKPFTYLGTVQEFYASESNSVLVVGTLGSGFIFIQEGRLDPTTIGDWHHPRSWLFDGHAYMEAKSLVNCGQKQATNAVSDRTEKNDQ